MNWGPRRGVLAGCRGFLTIHLEDRVIQDIMDDLVEPKNHILKVLYHYPIFWPKYKGLSPW